MSNIADKPAPVAADNLSKPAAIADKPRRLRTLLRAGAAAVVLLGGAATASWWFAEGRFIESTDDAYVQGDIAVLGPRIEGDVAAIHVADNQPVHAGDPLISLDPVDWQARLDQADGGAAEAAAAAVTAHRQIDQQRAAIAQAAAMVEQAQAELTRATADAGRSSALVGAGWTSRQANDQAVADRRKAAAQLASTQAQLASAQQALAVAESQAAQADAHRQTAEAAARLARQNLADTIIRAPFDGIAGNRAAQLGQHVMPGQQLIAVAPPPSQLYVTANFKETQLRHMKAGDPVVVTPDIDSAAEVRGRIDSLAPATGALFSLLPPENATGNFTKVVQRVPVRIALDAGQASAATWLRSGLSVTAEVDTRGAHAQRLGLLGVAAATLKLK